MKKAISIVTIGILSLILVAIIAAAIYYYRNKAYTQREWKKLVNAGYVEKSIRLPDNSIINYGEGPDNGIPLLFIHGQEVDWKDYAPVLPELAKYFHVYAVDCYGHGKSSKDPGKYSVEAIGRAFMWFIQNVIKQPVIVSGHSSGGLLAAWLAANAPQNIRGAILEDPPLFSTEPGAAQKTFAWQSFRTMYEFSVQSKEKDYALYMIKHADIQRFVPEKSWEKISERAINIRKKNPQKVIFGPWAPAQINDYWRMISGQYDYRFGITFYDFSWFRNFNQAETLQRISCRVIIIHNNVNYDKDGTLLAAMSKDDAKKAQQLTKNSKLIHIDSGYDSHVEKPKEFIEIVINFSKELNKH